ncbi:polysaccharide deacetylase family protein [Actinomadura sp. ATCC 31491]|uniref:Polysaccharide deacetylase family protein n=1 Tax=Actinomadura luzonensis TaxID=2805427 RepID=A0ABT0FYH7_9ACTN|nr:polysaccharide deacetylase family protein [Actinomadura luzonensis]MCK2217403.1 polysaccharide deacetylase family protein [Actinomadura luzonensis]
MRPGAVPAVSPRPAAVFPLPAAVSLLLVAVFPLLAAVACAPGPADPPPPATPAAPAASAAPSPGTSATAGPPQGPPGVLPRPGEVRPLPAPTGPLPVISSIPTRRKVVFLTIDDGWEQDPGFLGQVRDRRIPVTVFAMRDAVEAKGVPDQAGGTARYVGAGKWDYFRALRDAGAPVENHTLTHPDLRTLPYAAQRREICGSSRLIEKQLGTRPALFRPPFGSYGADTLRAAKSCGMDAVLLWTATVQPGGKIAYQVPDKRLRPGDILLLHFRPNLARDFRVLVRKIERRGYELGNLQAYLEAAVRPAADG